MQCNEPSYDRVERQVVQDDGREEQDVFVRAAACTVLDRCRGVSGYI